MGVGRSLIQLTVDRVDRLKPICLVENMWVVTHEKYISIVKEQIPDMPVDNILAEPEARNTAPRIAYACWKIQKKHPKANIVVTPSDALVIIELKDSHTLCIVNKIIENDKINNNK